MHGGTMALFGVMAQTLTERQMKINPLLLLPGFIIAITIHSVFNHCPGTPILTTLGTLLALPPIFLIVFEKSARSMHEWLEVDFDGNRYSVLEISKSSRPKTGGFFCIWQTKDPRGF